VLLLAASLFLFIGVVAYFVSQDQIAMVMLGGVALVMAYFLFRSPDLATLIFVFVLYTNLAAVATAFHRVPTVVASLSFLLPALPLAYYVFRQHQRVVFDRPLYLMLLYLAALVATSILALDMALAFNLILSFLLEGMIVYFLTINAIRTLPTLKRVMWVLLLACSVLGGITLFQELTHTYENNYGGFAQRREDLDVDEVDFDEYSGSRSAGGPFGGENRYAQIMVVIVPIAMYFFLTDRSRKAKVLSAGAGALILSGILLTFSRGAFVTLVVLGIIMIFLGFIRVRKALLGLVVCVLLMSVALPEYFEQVSSVGGLSSLATQQSNEIRSLDGSFRGRYAQILAAIRAFSEHPLAGVGPGHFPRFYARRYGNEVGTKFLRGNRRAHNLYLEIAADMGILGLVTFMSIVGFIVYRLWQVRRRLAQSRPDLAQLATAMILCILGYMGTAMFLQLSYQRYYWFLLALAGATLQVVKSETSRDALNESTSAPQVVAG
jgi:O-antigen ligase